MNEKHFANKHYYYWLKECFINCLLCVILIMCRHVAKNIIIYWSMIITF